MIRARLGEIDLVDLLRALEGGRKSALISLSCPQLSGRIHLHEGKIAYVQTQPGPHLGEYLVRLDYLTLEQVQALVGQQRQENPGTPLGLLVLQQQLIREKRGCGGAIIPRFSPRHGEATGIHGLPHVRRWRT